MLPLALGERVVEPIVIKKANQFVFFNFRDDLLLDILNVLGGTMSLDSSIKTQKTSETKVFLPDERFNDPEYLNNTQFPPYDTFFGKLRNNNPLEREYSDFQ